MNNKLMVIDAPAAMVELSAGKFDAVKPTPTTVLGFATVTLLYGPVVPVEVCHANPVKDRASLPVLDNVTVCEDVPGEDPKTTPAKSTVTELMVSFPAAATTTPDIESDASFAYPEAAGVTNRSRTADSVPAFVVLCGLNVTGKLNLAPEATLVVGRDELRHVKVESEVVQSLTVMAVFALQVTVIDEVLPWTTDPKLRGLGVHATGAWFVTVDEPRL